MTQLLNDIEAAEILRLTPRQVTRLARRGELPSVAFPNREVRFDPTDLQEFINSAKRPVGREVAR
jgi:excisionase family DNA binding protein